MVAATDIGFVRMELSKVVGVRDEDRVREFVVLGELDGDRRLLIQIGRVEAFALAASLSDTPWGRPMTYQFMAELVRSLGGRIRGPIRPGRLVDLGGRPWWSTLVVNR